MGMKVRYYLFFQRHFPGKKKKNCKFHALSYKISKFLSGYRYRLEKITVTKQVWIGYTHWGLQVDTSSLFM